MWEWETFGGMYTFVVIICLNLDKHGDLHLTVRASMLFTFSVFALREGRKNTCSLTTFLLLLKKTNYRKPCSFLYRFENAKFVFILK